MPISISLRGLFFLAFVAILLAGPATTQADIVAAVIGYTFLALFSLLFVVTSVGGLYLKRNLLLQIIMPSGQTRLHSGRDKVCSNQKAPILFKADGPNLPPFFSLSLTVNWNCQWIASQRVIFSGRLRKTVLKQEVSFPFRGAWKISSLSLKFEDPLGLSSFNWSLTDEKHCPSIEIYPLTADASQIPIMSSQYRPGDTLPDTEERSGEFFDLKPYHPADGVRRILWKIFARSGELISRHPEQAMQPEGKACVFVAANRDEDSVASIALAYAQAILDSGLELEFTCRGQQNNHPARTIREAEDLTLIYPGLEDDQISINPGLSSVLNSSKPTPKVIVFISENELTSLMSNSSELHTLLSPHQVAPALVILSSQKVKSTTGNSAFLKQLLFLPTPGDLEQNQAKETNREEVVAASRYLAQAGCKTIFISQESRAFKLASKGQ